MIKVTLSSSASMFYIDGLRYYQFPSPACAKHGKKLNPKGIEIPHLSPSCFISRSSNAGALTANHHFRTSSIKKTLALSITQRIAALSILRFSDIASRYLVSLTQGKNPQSSSNRLYALHHHMRAHLRSIQSTPNENGSVPMPASAFSSPCPWESFDIKTSTITMHSIAQQS